MKITILLTVLLLLVSGCASLPVREVRVERSPQSINLARANELLKYGDKAGAIRALTAVTDANGVTGITDEALFRLALLIIHPVAESGDNLLPKNLLNRLNKEYPRSSWSVQSGPLIDLLASAEELERQVKSLKSQNQTLRSQTQTLRSQNQTLGSEVNELNRNINQLKQLDQELEKRRH